MDQAGKTFTSEGAEARRWIGRIIMAVILGEAIWGLIVSVMNNLVVPWLGDAMGPSSGLPTSFTQRPYNYPDLFVSVLEACSAGLVAAVLNYFFQRPRAGGAAGKVKPVKSPVAAVLVEPARMVPQAAAAPAPAHTGMTPNASLIAPPAPAAKPDPIIPSAVVAMAPAPPVAPAPVARLVTPPAPAVANSIAAKPLPPAPKAEPAKPKKPKEVYYNIVGEPMPSDED